MVTRKARNTGLGFAPSGFSLLKDNPIFSDPAGFLDTGNCILNQKVSGSARKGWPLGKIVELFGDPSTGKSLLAYHALAEAQRLGGVAFLDDVENAFDPTFGEKIGIDLDQLLLSSSETVEECFDNIRKTLEGAQEVDSPSPLVFVVDSVAALSTRHEQETGFEKIDLSKPKLLRQATRALTHPVAKAKALLLVLNQTYSSMDPYAAQKKVATGGGGFKFASTVRLELLVAKALPGDPPKGVLTKYKVVKNRAWAPFGVGVIEILFDSGLDRWSGLLEALISSGSLEECKGGYYKLDGLEDKVRASKFTTEFWMARAKAKGIDCLEEYLDSLFLKEAPEAVEEDDE